MPRPAADWEAIERDYRAGLLSLREIAAPQGISEAAIRKRARRDGWERNLAARIAAKAEALVRKDVVRDEVRNEREIVEANAQMQAQTILRHRRDIQRHNEIASEHETELEQASELAITVRIEAHKKLVETRKTLIGLEREALGINSDRTPGQTLDDFLDAISQS